MRTIAVHEPVFQSIWAETAARVEVPAPGTIIKPTRKHIRVWYYDELEPGTIIELAECFNISERPIICEGKRAFIAHQLR